MTAEKVLFPFGARELADPNAFERAMREFTDSFNTNADETDTAQSTATTAQTSADTAQTSADNAAHDVCQNPSFSWSGPARMTGREPLLRVTRPVH